MKITIGKVKIRKAAGANVRKVATHRNKTDYRRKAKHSKKWA